MGGAKPPRTLPDSRNSICGPICLEGCPPCRSSCRFRNLGVSLSADSRDHSFVATPRQAMAPGNHVTPGRAKRSSAGGSTRTTEAIVTRNLRKRHRVWILVGWMAIPPVLVTGWKERMHTQFPSVTSPAPREPQAAGKGETWEKPNAWPTLPLAIRFSNSPSGAPQLTFDWTKSESFLSPDILVYWIPDTKSTEDTLPPQSVFIGVLKDGIPQLVPKTAWNHDGQLWLYSLGHQKVVARSQAVLFRVKES